MVEIELGFIGLVIVMMVVSCLFIVKYMGVLVFLVSVCVFFE